MRYLVSGANGFVGLRLCRFLLERGCRVRALIHRNTAGPWHEQVVWDLGNGKVPMDACRGIDGIFHLAGIAHLQDRSGVDESLYKRVNVDGTRVLLEAAQAVAVSRFVYFSSVKAASDPGSDCVDETWDAPPTAPYGCSKREAERLVLAASDALPHVSVLRPTLVYGAGVKGNLRRMIDAVASRRFPPLPELSNRRSMVSVSDLAAAAWLAMTLDAANRRIYIVADGMDYSTRSLYLAICNALGRQAPSWALPSWLLKSGLLASAFLTQASGRSMQFGAVLERLCGSSCYRSDRLRSELGWRPTQTFFDLVNDMVAGTEGRELLRQSSPPR